MADWKKAPKAPEPAPTPAPEPAVEAEPEVTVEFDLGVEMPSLGLPSQAELLAQISEVVGFQVTPMMLLGLIFVLAVGLLLYGMWERDPEQEEIDKYRPDEKDRMQ